MKLLTYIKYNMESLHDTSHIWNWYKMGNDIVHNASQICFSKFMSIKIFPVFFMFQMKFISHVHFSKMSVDDWPMQVNFRQLVWLEPIKNSNIPYILLK